MDCILKQILVINKLNAQNVISLLYASTCFEHYVLIITRSKLYYTASGTITPVGGRPLHRLRDYNNTILTSWWWAHSARNM